MAHNQHIFIATDVSKKVYNIQELYVTTILIVIIITIVVPIPITMIIITTITIRVVDLT